MKKHNIFITFEGGEGSGKTTVIKKVQEKLEKLSIRTLVTREPGGNHLEFQKEIRRIIMENKDLDLMTELLLFSADRREHITKVIKPALANGDMVISDRYADSTTVYQGVVKGLSKSIVGTVNKIVTADAIPHLTFIFDIDPEVAQERMTKNQRKRNRFDDENLDFHHKVRKAFLDLAKKDPVRYKVIDASKPVEEVYKQVMRYILDEDLERKLKKHNTLKTMEVKLEIENEITKERKFKK